MSTKPTDIRLYNKIKARIYRENPKHGLGRSMQLVREYKKAFKRKFGNTQEPYTKGEKGTKKWFRQDWRQIDNKGNIGRHCLDKPHRKDGIKKCLPRKKLQNMTKEERKKELRNKIIKNNTK